LYYRLITFLILIEDRVISNFHSILAYSASNDVKLECYFCYASTIVYVGGNELSIIIINY